MSSTARYWAVIPAAGVGSRMQADIPKQYLQVLDKTILEHTLEQFCNHPSIEAVVVVISKDDPYWPTLDIKEHPKIKTTEGGSERCHSVLNGLVSLQQFADSNDWVMVHDAARPCLFRNDIDKLIHQIADHPVGGILATPVRDTMKRSNQEHEITETVSRESLWHAMTPQVFRLKSLLMALKSAIDGGILVTDDAQAIELTGVKPLLISGPLYNIKITHMGDLSIAEHYLKSQE